MKSVALKFGFGIQLPADNRFYLASSYKDAIFPLLLVMNNCYDDSMAVPCKKLCRRWSTSGNNDLDLEQFDPSDLTSMASVQVKQFLAFLVEKPPLSFIKVQKMNELYKLNDVKNSEVRFRWLRLCVKAQWKESIPRVLDFVNEQGRMRFVRPLYRDLYAWEDARPTAIENFKKHREEMHNITAMMLAKDLKLS